MRRKQLKRGFAFRKPPKGHVYGSTGPVGRLAIPPPDPCTSLSFRDTMPGTRGLDAVFHGLQQRGSGRRSGHAGLAK